MENFEKQPPEELKEIADMRAKRIVHEHDQAIAELEAGMRDSGITGKDIDAQKEAVRKQRLRKPDPMI